MISQPSAPTEMLPLPAPLQFFCHDETASQNIHSPLSYLVFFHSNKEIHSRVSESKGNIKKFEGG